MPDALHFADRRKEPKRRACLGAARRLAKVFRRIGENYFHQQRLAGALDGVRDLGGGSARGHAGGAAGQDLAALRDVALEEFRVLPVDGVQRNVDCGRRGIERLALRKGGTACGRFWVCSCYLISRCTVRRFEVRVIFKPSPAGWACFGLFLLRRGDVAGKWVSPLLSPPCIRG